MLYNLAKKNYDKFLVPTSEVSALKTKRYNTTIHKTDLDKKTSVNKIGEIVNLSQILNSVLWEFKKFNQNYDEIYLDICKLSVMSNIAIDMAKKEFDINLEIELNELRNKYKEYVKNKPLFFYTLPVPDRFKKSKDKYKIYATSMDYLIQSFDKIGNKTKKSREETINIIDLFKKVKNSNEKNRNYQIITILNLIIQYKTNCNLIWGSNLENSEKYSKGISGVFEKAGYSNRTISQTDIKKEENSSNGNSNYKEVTPIENKTKSPSNTEDSLFQRLLGN